MTGIFSIWVKPARGSEHKKVFGFHNEHYFEISCKFAVMLARRRFSKLVLITDKAGEEMLVGKFGIEFDEVKVVLDEMTQGVPQNLWAFGKLCAYSLFDAPAYHLDLDMFFRKPLPDWIYTTDLCTQSREPFETHEYYRWCTNTILKTWRNLPPALEAIKNLPFGKQMAYNTALLGGQDWRIVRDYAKVAMQLIKDNIDNIENLTLPQQSELNVAVEQWFFWAYCNFLGKKANVLMENCSPDECEDKGFIHLIAGSKGDETLCKNMETSYNIALNGAKYWSL